VAPIRNGEQIAIIIIDEEDWILIK